VNGDGGRGAAQRQWMDGWPTAGLAAGHGDKRAPDGRRLSTADDEWASSGRLAAEATTAAMRQHLQF